jgi:hypothetical protein
VNYSNNTNAGTATASASFAGDANHTASSDSKTFTINQAASTTTVTCPASVTFDGSAQTPCTATVTGAGGLSQALTVNYSSNTNAGTATASASFAGDANHTASSDSKTFTIAQASSTTTVTCPASVAYTGAAQEPCTATVTGAGGLSLTPTPSYSNNTNAGTATASASFAGDANHTASSDSKTFTIDQASSTTAVVAGTTSGTYTATVSPVAPATTVPTGTVQFSIDATPIGGPVTLDGSGQATSAVLSTPEAAGSHTITAAYSGDTDYKPSTGTLTDTASAVADDAYATLQSSTLAVSAPGVLGNDSDQDSGQTLQAFVTQAPAQGTLTLAPDGSFTYAPAPGAGGRGVFIFKYTVFDGVLYSPEATGTITVLAGSETPVALNDAYSVTTNGTLTVPAARGVLANDHGQPLQVVLPVLSGVRHGTLTPNASGDGGFTYTPTGGFTGVDSFLYQATDGIHTSNAAMVTITVLAADDTNAVDDYYLTTDGAVSGNVLSNDNGAPTAAAVATGPLYGTLTSFASDGTFTYEPGINFSGVDSFTYRASGGTNAGNLATVTIRRPDISVDAPAVTYGNDATMTVTVTFPGLGPATGSVSLSTANATVAAPTTVTLDANGQATFTVTQPTAANSPYTLTAVFTTAEYTGSSTGNGSLTVNKASSTTTVTCPASVTFDGAAQEPCTASVTGAGGLSLTPTPSYSYNTNAGTATASYTYAGDANHAGSSDSKTFAIAQAAVTATAGSGSATYDGATKPPSACAVTGAYTGDLSCANNPATVGPDAGTTTITPVVSGIRLINFAITPINGSFTIAQAGSTTVVTCPASVTYTGATQTPCSVTVTGAGGLSLTPTPSYSYNTNAGTATASYTYAGDANHTGSSDSKPFTIAKAAVTAAAGSGSATYDGATKPPSACAVTGAYTGDLSCANSPATVGPDAGTTTITPVVNGTGLTNFAITPVNGSFTIGQATPTVSVTGGTFTDNAQPHPATGFAYGVSVMSDVLSPAVTFSYAGTGATTYGPTSSAPSTPGTYLATATFAGNANYTTASNTAAITITNAAPQAQSQTGLQAIATNEDVPLSITLRARDLDGPNSLTFTITGGPSHGSLGSITTNCTPAPIAPGAMSCTGTVMYTPNANYNGSDSFTFKGNDGELDSNEATVSITVYPVNDTPTANAQSVTTDDAHAVNIPLTGSDLETAPANLTFAIVDQPLHGTLSGSPPNVTYTPNLSYKGPDSFTFTVTDRGDPDGCGTPSQTCAGVKTSPPAAVSMTVTDGTSPITLITSLKPASLSNDRNPSFGFSGTDNVTDPSALSFECSLDFAPWTVCGTAGTPTTSFSNLGDGSHTFQVRAKDDSGNADPNPPSYTWIIDATPPDTVIDSHPPVLANTSTATFTFHSTENNGTLACSLNGGPAVDCSGGTKTYSGLVDGPYTFTVAATDQAGNVDPSPATWTWTIDTTAPGTAIDSQPSNPTTSTTATFTFHGSDPAGQDTFACSLDGSGFTLCTNPTTYTGLALGQHTFAVRATDQAGNTGTRASYTWTIGQVALDQYTIDTNFNKFDGFDVVFGGGSKSMLKINATNSDSFHYQVKLTNNTGTPISQANGNMTTAIITVPGMPASCGGVPCSTQIGTLGDPAFVIKGKKVAHILPGQDNDNDGDADDMPITLQYMTQAQYVANGNTCADNGQYGSTLPADGAPKCIKITGFTIPVKHMARIRINFQFRLKGVDGWDPNSKTLFYAGFVFRADSSVTVGSNVQKAADATGIVGAGNKSTSIGGFALNGATPLTGYTVRLLNQPSDASCTNNTKLIAQDVVAVNGFYYIWRTGTDQRSSTAPSLPDGAQYTVQLCNGGTQVGVAAIDHKLKAKEFEQIDFEY